MSDTSCLCCGKVGPWKTRLEEQPSVYVCMECCDARSERDALQAELNNEKEQLSIARARARIAEEGFARLDEKTDALQEERDQLRSELIRLAELRAMQTINDILRICPKCGEDVCEPKHETCYKCDPERALAKAEADKLYAEGCNRDLEQHITKLRGELARKDAELTKSKSDAMQVALAACDVTSSLHDAGDKILAANGRAKRAEEDAKRLRDNLNITEAALGMSGVYDKLRAERDQLRSEVERKERQVEWLLEHGINEQCDYCEVSSECARDAVVKQTTCKDFLRKWINTIE